MKLLDQSNYCYMLILSLSLCKTSQYHQPNHTNFNTQGQLTIKLPARLLTKWGKGGVRIVLQIEGLEGTKTGAEKQEVRLNSQVI